MPTPKATTPAATTSTITHVNQHKWVQKVDNAGHSLYPPTHTRQAVTKTQYESTQTKPAAPTLVSVAPNRHLRDDRYGCIHLEKVCRGRHTLLSVCEVSCGVEPFLDLEVRIASQARQATVSGQNDGWWTCWWMSSPDKALQFGSVVHIISRKRMRSIMKVIERKRWFVIMVLVEYCNERRLAIILG